MRMTRFGILNPQIEGNAEDQYRYAEILGENGYKDLTYEFDPIKKEVLKCPTKEAVVFYKLAAEQGACQSCVQAWGCVRERLD